LPAYQQREREGRVDRSLLREMGKLGFLGMDLADRYGGMDVDAVTTGMIIEELSYGDFNVGALAVVQSLCGAVIQRNGTASVKETWLPRIVRAKRFWRSRSPNRTPVRTRAPCACGRAAMAIITCSTVRKRLPLLPIAQMRSSCLPGLEIKWTAQRASRHFLFLAIRRDCNARASRMSAAICPAGISILRRRPHSRRSSPWCEGKGFSEVMSGFDCSRALIALQCIGAAQASVDEAWAYTREREAFGGPIAQFQGVTVPLVEGETLLAAGRQLAYHALTLRDAGAPHTVEAAMVKWFGPRTAFDVIHQCLLTFGHYGWSMDLPHQQRMRDVMGLEIGDGTAGIMKMIVARARAGQAANPKLSKESAA